NSTPPCAPMSISTRLSVASTKARAPQPNGWRTMTKPMPSRRRPALNKRLPSKRPTSAMSASRPARPPPQRRMSARWPRRCRTRAWCEVAMTPSRPKSQPDRPWQMPRIEDADIFALQAIANGTANNAQQQRAYEYVVRTLCETDRMTFWPGGEDGKRATDFAEGKRWVGLQLRRIEKMRPDHGGRVA